MAVSLGRRIWTFTKIGLGVPLAIFSVFIALGPKSEIVQQFDRLESEGMAATGKVLAVWDTKDSSTRRGNAFRHAFGTERYTRHVTFEFRTPAGETIKQDRQFDAADHVGPREGAPIEVLYHPQSPRINRLIRYSEPYRPADPMTTLITAMLFLLAGGYLIVRNGLRVLAWRAESAGSRSFEANAGLDRLELAPRSAAREAVPMTRPLMAGGTARASGGFGNRRRA